MSANEDLLKSIGELLDNRLGQLETRVDVKLERLDSRVDAKFEIQKDYIDSHFNGVNNHFKQLDQTLIEMEKRIKRDLINESSKFQIEVIEGIAKLDEKISRIEKQTQHHEKDITEIKYRLRAS